jgi:hypothetical protein
VRPKDLLIVVQDGVLVAILVSYIKEVLVLASR